MDVALLTEGTYPHSFGGVSVWCDQLVQGLAAHRFHLVALVAGGDEQVAWTLPGNVDSVTAIPLWGNANTPDRRPGRSARRRFRPLVRDFLDTLLDPTEEGQRGFGAALRALFEYGQTEDLGAALRHEDTVIALAQTWQDGWLDSERGAPTVADALTGLQLLEHSLRPLVLPPVQVQVSHCVANGLAVLPALAAKWSHGTPILLTEHGIYLRERYLGYRRGPYRWPVKALQLAFLRKLCALAYSEASAIAPGNVYNQRWEERLGARHSIIRTVYNGVDPDQFPPVEAEPEVPTVSWAGRVDPIKDIETLLRGFAIVHQRMPEARLRLFGGTPKGGQAYQDRCRALAEELGIGEVATFEGRVDKIRDAYVAGHVVVLSSISEGFPYTVIEAMTCGRPCVATDVGGVSEAVADTGLIVPPRDPEALAEACLTLLRDEELRARLGAAARARVLEYFTLGKAIDTFDEMYHKLIAPPVRPARLDQTTYATLAGSLGTPTTWTPTTVDPAAPTSGTKPVPSGDSAVSSGHTLAAQTGLVGGPALVAQPDLIGESALVVQPVGATEPVLVAESALAGESAVASQSALVAQPVLAAQSALAAAATVAAASALDAQPTRAAQTALGGQSALANPAPLAGQSALPSESALVTPIEPSATGAWR